MDNQPETPPDPLIGQLIQGRYRVERVLGKGGMSQVYLAEQVNLKRPIVLKVLRDMYAQDEQSVARFQREAERAAHLTHPRIVTIHDFGPLVEGGFFIAMEYVLGPTLGELLKNERLSVPRALQLGIQIAEGLQVAHRAGTIHRDVKPANIIVQEGDQIKLVDFGIARAQDSQTHLTHTGQAVGTPKYMAPEQWGVGTVSKQTDLYALGIVLYEMLSGRAPFSAPTPALMRMHLEEPPPPLRPLQPAVPLSVEQIVLRALEKQPEQRQRDMGELIVELQAVLASWDHEEETGRLSPDQLGTEGKSQPSSGATVETRLSSPPPPSPPDPTPQPRPVPPPPDQAVQTTKRRRSVVWLGIVLGIGLAGLLAFQLVATTKIDPHPPPPSSQTSDQPAPSTETQQQLQSHLQMGLFYIDREQYTEAIAELEKAQEIDLTNEEVRTALALAQRGGAPVLSPEQQEQLQSHLQLGIFYLERGQQADAIAALEKAQVLDPTNAEVQANLARARQTGNGT